MGFAVTQAVVRATRHYLARNVPLFDHSAVRRVDHETRNCAEATGVGANFPAASGAKPLPPQRRGDGFDKSPALLVGGCASDGNCFGFVDHLVCPGIGPSAMDTRSNTPPTVIDPIAAPSTRICETVTYPPSIGKR